MSGCSRHTKRTVRLYITPRKSQRERSGGRDRGGPEKGFSVAFGKGSLANARRHDADKISNVSSVRIGSPLLRWGAAGEDIEPAGRNDSDSE
jgi:hypothetical protein